MSHGGNFRGELVKLIPNLRGFALSLTQSVHHSDDLVQETLVKALSNLDKFEVGTNLRAWLFTILRNTFYNDTRYKRYHATAPLDNAAPGSLELQATQEKYIEFKDVLKGLQRLAAKQREVIVLIAAEGLSYDEAAAICNCPVGTIKSRLSRARQHLGDIMNGDAALPKPAQTDHHCMTEAPIAKAGKRTLGRVAI
jgi:RNA polymerase sigma-70 factor (ECF subfamily)